MKRIVLILILGLALNTAVFAQPTIFLPTVAPCTNESVCMDVTVKDFTDILSMNFSIRFDPEVVRFDQVRDFGLPLLDENDFDLSKADSGIITLKWQYQACSPSSMGVTIDDQTVIFSLCFTALGTYGQATGVTIANEPEAINVTRVNACPNNIGLFAENGLISTCVRPLKLIASEQTANEGDLVCVDFKVTGFDDLTSMQFSINWDPAVLNFENVIVLENLINLSLSGFGTPDEPNIDEGNLTVSWSYVNPQNPGVSLPDSTSIFQVCFRVVGPCESSSVIDFTSSPTPIEVTNTIEEGFQILVEPEPGEVQVGKCDPTGLPLFVNCGDSVSLNETFCIPITVNDLRSITEFSYLMQWNPNILRFQGINNINGSISGFDLNDFNRNNTVNGVLGVNWKAANNLLAATLPNGTVLYEVCFEVVGLGGNSPFQFANSPAVVRRVGSNENIGINPSNCEVKVIQPQGVTLTIGQTAGQPGDTVCMDFLVNNFEEIVSMQFSLAWDESQMQFVSVENLALPESSLAGNFDLGFAAAGGLTFDWEPASNYSLPDGTSIFQLCFQVIGDPELCNDINVVDLPIEAEVINTSSNGINVGLTARAGEICVLNPDGFTLLISDEEGYKGDTVCVEFRADAFENITAAKYTINWAPAALDFISVETTGELGLTLAANFDTTSAGVGIIGFNWSGDAATLADSTLLYRLCFRLIGPVRECNDILINSIPEPAVTTANGPGSLVVEGGSICIEDRLVIENIAITPVTCPDAEDGTIKLEVSGGTNPVFFNWNSTPTQFGDRAINLPVGQVVVTIFDSSDPVLVMRDTFEIPLTTELPTVNAGRDVTFACNPGFVLLTGTGSVGENYVYRWTTPDGTLPGETDALLTVAGAPGQYILTVSNRQTGCSVRDTVLVRQPVLPAVNAGPDQTYTCVNDVLILDGSASATGQNIQYQWTASEGGVIEEGQDTIQSPTVSVPGTYILKVTNSTTGCTATDSVIVLDGAIYPDAVAGDDVEIGCGGEIITLDGSASNNERQVTYQWVNPAGEQLSPTEQLAVNALGTYILKVTDNETGCVTADTLQVLPNSDFPQADAGENLILDCGQDTLQLSATIENNPAVTFQWQTLNGGAIVPGTETSITPRVTAPGTYSLIATNNTTTCTLIDTVQVTDNRVFPVAEAGEGFALTCDSTSYTLDGTGSSVGENFTYAWIRESSTVAQDTLMVEVSDGGTYILEVRDTTNSCLTIDSVVVALNNQTPQITIDTASTLNCLSGTVDLSAEIAPAGSIYDIQWEVVGDAGNIASGATTLNPVVDQAGTYRIKVTNTETGCIGENDVIVRSDIQAPLANAGQDQTINCLSDTVMLNGSGSSSGSNITYQWTSIEGGSDPQPGNTAQVAVNLGGTYELLVTNTNNGCTSKDTVVVNEDTVLPEIIFATPEEVTCEAPQVTLDATQSSGTEGNVSIEWSGLDAQNIQTTADPLIVEVEQGGRYQLLIRNNTSGCEASATLDVPQNTTAPEAVAVTDVVLKCIGLTVNLDGNGSASGPTISYQWSAVDGGGNLTNPASLTPSVDRPGTYELKVTDSSNGCSSTAQVVVRLDSSLEQADAGDDFSVCSDTALLFGNLPVGTIGQWSTKLNLIFETPNESSTFVRRLQRGSNIVVWSLSTAECPNYSIDSVAITFEQAPVAVDDQVTLPLGATEFGINVAANDQLNTNSEWEVSVLNSPALGVVDSTIRNGIITYKIRAGLFGIDELTYQLCNNTCPELCDSARVEIAIDVDPDYEAPPLPNAITPNGDGLNDVLIFDILENTNEEFPDNELIVFNRWGDIVYTARPYLNNWQGTNDTGQELPHGTYYYILRLDIPNGVILKGDITIVK